jgi:hypothetical protein
MGKDWNSKWNRNTSSLKWFSLTKSYSILYCTSETWGHTLKIYSSFDLKEATYTCNHTIFKEKGHKSLKFFSIINFYNGKWLILF